MKKLQTPGIVTAVLTAGLFSASAANADGLCEMVKSCNNGCYTFASRTSDIQSVPQTEGGDCQVTLDAAQNDYVSFKVPLSWAPTPTVIDCGGTAGNFACEAWPQGDRVTYGWSTTGGFQISSGTAANPFRNFTCTHGTAGTITMTALSPQGAASSVTTSVTCP